MKARKSCKMKCFSKKCTFATTFFSMFFVIFFKQTNGLEAVLMDTRTAISDLGWTMPAGSEWQEMTSSDSTGNQRRMLMACQIRKPHQDNWMRSQYIPVHGAQRIYIEIEFTIRSCEGISQVATCKETFNLYYYETDRDEATTTFPPWTSESYSKVDTIAADQRFEPGSQKTNFEVRDVGPITKNGIYLAVQDTGACVAIMHVRVYYMYCKEKTANLATFPRTISGPEVTSLVEAKGVCVLHAVEENGIGARLHCNGKGKWLVPSGVCLCKEGYTPNSSRTRCEACLPGYFKRDVSNQPCKRCPDYSLSSSSGADVCECMEGYYRSALDDPELSCTKPPSQPTDLNADVNGSTVRLTWKQPHSLGGRLDLSYRISCFTCNSQFNRCENCNNREHFSPSSEDLTNTYVTVTQLAQYAFYQFKVCSVNGVTSVATSNADSIECCTEIRFETNQSGPGLSSVEGLEISDVTHNSFTLTWSLPSHIIGPILDYQIIVQPANHMTSSLNPANQIEIKKSRERHITITGLHQSTLYIVKVRARTNEGYGPYSLPIRVQTDYAENPTNGQNIENISPQDDDKTYLILAIVVAFVLIFAAIVIFFICKRRKRMPKFEPKSHDVELRPIVYDKTLPLQNGFEKVYKTYVDPTTYDDFNKAVMDFTKELDRSCIDIGECIGGGEFSEVFSGLLSSSDEDDRKVAIKTLKVGFTNEQKQDFLAEASIMGQFDHPFVIRLEGVVTKSFPLMIITEFMENGALDQFLKKHVATFTINKLLWMLRNIVSGMKYLSDMGYVHRDLAARNILVNSEMVCKVSDFGLSREIDDEAEAVYTARNEKIPLRWTAPEAITFRKFTSASDVWSFGIVMWEVMSYGETPYWDMPNHSVMSAVESGNRLPSPVGCPQPLHQLMLDCWKKDRNQRPKFEHLLSSFKTFINEPWKLNDPQASKDVNHETPLRTVGFVRPSSNFSRDSSRHLLLVSRGSSTHVVNTDSGINEDTDEESPMISNAVINRTGDDHRESIPRSSSLDTWLNNVGLYQYQENFIRNGCGSLDQVALLNSSDLARLGILNESHQEALLNSIQRFRITSENTIVPSGYNVAV